jgi:hypothetical protein
MKIMIFSVYPIFLVAFYIIMFLVAMPLKLRNYRNL